MLEVFSAGQHQGWWYPNPVGPSSKQMNYGKKQKSQSELFCSSQLCKEIEIIMYLKQLEKITKEELATVKNQEFTVFT
jgi:hypothetical protein